MFLFYPMQHGKGISTNTSG